MYNYSTPTPPRKFTRRLRPITFAALLLTALSTQFFAESCLGAGSQSQPNDLLGITLLPTISTPPLVSAQVGQAVNLQIGSTGNPSNYGATGLPTGLNINPVTGLISGTPTLAGLFTGTVSASNLLGTGTAPLVVNVLPAIPVTPVVTAPVITSPTVAAGQVGQLLSFQVGGTGNPTSYGVTGLPAGLNINTASGLISGAPTQAGVFTADVTANNLVGGGSAPLVVTILPVGTGTLPALPSITSPTATSGQVGQLLSYQIGATGSPTSYAASGLPAGLMLNTASGLISGTPTQAGVFTASLTATNAQGSTTTPLTLSVLPNGSGLPAQFVPTITTPVAASGQVGQLLGYQIGATGNPASYGATGLPAGLSVNASTGLIAGTPTQAGLFTANVTATNALGTGSTPLTLTILPANTGTSTTTVPTIISPVTASGQVGQLLSYQIGATGSPTTYAVVNLPAGLSLNASTGLISGLPTQAGTTTATVSAGNSQGTGTAPLTLAIAADPTGTSTTTPVLTATAPPAGEIGMAYSYQIAASGNPTSYGATGLPTGLSVDANSGLVSGAPTQAGTFSAVLTATNAGGTGSAAATFTVLPTAPMITSAAGVDVPLGEPFTFQIEATGDPTSFTASGLPPGLGVDTTTGVISGNATQGGVFPVMVSATNAGGTTSGTLTFSVQSGDSTAPTITSPAMTVAQVGQPYSYQVTTTDGATSFSATGLPPGLSIDPTTGWITGIPTQSGTYDVVVTATGPGGTSTGRMRLVIAGSAPASAPVITSATGGTVQVGDAYSYQITATNSPTNFGAVGLPAGLTLDPGTGLITGAPTRAGNFSFVISAANASGVGMTTVSLVITPILPVVTITSSIPSFTVDSGEMGQFELTRTGSTAEILVVTYTIHGSVANGTDIEKLKGVKKFKVGKATVHINVVSLVRDMGGVDKKVVKVVLDARPTYKLSGSPQAKVKMLAP